ncbi:protein of unknown function [Aminobacter niigataensis]|nr:protein of unknown function [Aminobacter niigataensis]
MAPLCSILAATLGIISLPFFDAPANFVRVIVMIFALVITEFVVVFRSPLRLSALLHYWRADRAVYRLLRTPF